LERLNESAIGNDALVTLSLAFITAPFSLVSALLFEAILALDLKLKGWRFHRVRDLEDREIRFCRHVDVRCQEIDILEEERSNEYCIEGTEFLHY
jgi:hypothetical protein